MSSREPRYLTLRQVATRTGRHPELLRQWCAVGRVPCQRVGGSWVLLADDLPLVEAITRRGSRPPGREAPSIAAGTRLIAAAFDDDATAGNVADALRGRLPISGETVAATSVSLKGLPGLRLTIVAGRFPAAATGEARRIIVGFGGRIVTDVDDGATETETAAAPARAATTRRPGRPAAR
jgi:hypothetical protein